MKKLMAISAAAIASFAITGCNNLGGGGSETFPIPYSHEEKVGSDTHLYETEYDETTWDVSSRTYKLNGTLVYTDENYRVEYEGGPVVNDRNFADGTKQKVSSTRAWINNEPRETKLEVLNQIPIENGVRGYVLERTENTFDEYDGRLIGYTYSKGDGEGAVEEMIHREDYSHDYGGYTYKERKGGPDQEFVTMRYNETMVYNSRVLGYEVLAGWDGREGTVVEEMSDYEATGLTETFTITMYNPDGTNPVETKVTNKYREITIEY